MADKRNMLHTVTICMPINLQRKRPGIMLNALLTGCFPAVIRKDISRASGLTLNSTGTTGGSIAGGQKGAQVIDDHFGRAKDLGAAAVTAL